MKDKLFAVLIIVLSFIFMSGCQKNEEMHFANGELFVQPGDSITSLRGKWGFYPGLLLEPSDILIGSSYNADKRKVPGYLEKYRTGYGTYHLVLHFPENKIGKLQAISLPRVYSAYKLWINNELILENGKVARTKEKMVARGIPTVVYFKVPKQELNMVLQVSNFHYRHTGISGTVFLGNPAQIERKEKQEIYIEWFSIGAFLIMGIQHLSIYFSRRKERFSLYFALFCFLYGLRVLFIGHESISFLFPNISWSIILKLNFILLFSSVALYIKYFSLRFSSERTKQIFANIMIIALLLALAFVIVTREPVYTYTAYILFFIFILMIVPFLFSFIIKGIREKQLGSKIIGVSLIFLIGTALNDLLYDEQIINTAILSPLGFIVFIGAQSYLNSKMMARNLSEIELLSNELETTQKELLFKLGEITELRSYETGSHVRRVAEYCELLALKAGLSKEEAELIKIASPLHDVGKVSIPDSILNKPGKLTKEEFEIIKTHTTLGYKMLQQSNRKLLETAAIIALTHHEKYDGSGYPEGLKGEEIPLYGRITAIADVFDALGNERVYKKAWEMDKIIEYVRNEKGKHFDPVLVEIFLENIEEFIRIRESFR